MNETKVETPADKLVLALRRLEQLIPQLADAERAESAARSETTSIKNKISDTQKEIDKMINDVKQQAHRDTEWGCQRSRS